jgi:hypothetical protein
MSYSLVGFGADQPEPWERVWMESDEVYVLYIEMSGDPVTSKGDLRFILETAGRCFAKELGITVLYAPDVRAAIYREIDSSSYSVTIISTIERSTLGYKIPSAEDMSICLKERLNAGGLKVDVESFWYHYPDDQVNRSIIEAWRANPVIWDSDLGDGEGGPTNGWTNFEGLWVATDNDGAIGDYRKIKRFPGTPKGGLTPFPGTDGRSESRQWPWIIGGVGIITVAVLAAKKGGS